MYQKTRSGVLRLSDQAIIPDDPDNRDWQEYLEWKAEGNEPLPIPQPSIESLITQKIAAIKAAADAAVEHILSEYPDVEKKTFLKQEMQAEQYIEWHEEGQQGEAPSVPSIQQFAEERGLTMIEQAYRVRRKAQYFDLVANAVSGQRNKLYDDLMAIKGDDSLTDEQKREAIDAIDPQSITCPPPPEQ
ncbi:hypothetical protein [Sansalvadorimonas verongulae]|uniref:hypothetical protein n=1 Tax=Sansalvadorimonas verongulae TaxID=2172824 RepID=UPI0012BBFCCE|nr:hypothetical protein [Sansalvadorimonas verongulae]MTI13115.1 hypothetical protein [Sansalvadorimonas verongulae]